MKGKGVVLLAEDKAIEARAANFKLPVEVRDKPEVAFDKTLIITPGITVPWDMLSAAWHFLERWDAAVPLWRYGANADKLGTAADRKRTKAITRDLRIMTYSHELLFVRNNEAGRAMVDAWNEEMADGGDKRLAFLRAYYRVKPRCCVLPRSWLAEVQERSNQDARFSAPRRTGPLVNVEIAPGKYVRCHPGDEETVREQYQQRMSRRGRRG